PDPFFEAVEGIGAKPPIILLSPRGRRFTHDDAVRLATLDEFTLLCGHYKDVDQRVADHLATEALSPGDFALSGGEPAALAVIDAPGSSRTTASITASAAGSPPERTKS